MSHIWCRKEVHAGFSKDKLKKPLGRTQRSWVNNIDTGPKEIKWNAVDWIRIVQDKSQLRALLQTVRKIHVSYNVGI